MTNYSAARRRGRRDQAARAALAPLVESGQAICGRCGKPIDPADEWDAGHALDLVTGGHPDGFRSPEHSPCNRSAGAKVGNVMRSAARRRLRPSFFLNA